MNSLAHEAYAMLRHQVERKPLYKQRGLIELMLRKTQAAARQFGLWAALHVLLINTLCQQGQYGAAIDILLAMPQSSITHASAFPWHSSMEYGSWHGMLSWLRQSTQYTDLSRAHAAQKASIAMEFTSNCPISFVALQQMAAQILDAAGYTDAAVTALQATLCKLDIDKPRPQIAAAVGLLAQLQHKLQLHNAALSNARRAHMQLAQWLRNAPTLDSLAGEASSAFSQVSTLLCRMLHEQGHDRLAYEAALMHFAMCASDDPLKQHRQHCTLMQHARRADMPDAALHHSMQALAMLYMTGADNSPQHQISITELLLSAGICHLALQQHQQAVLFLGRAGISCLAAHRSLEHGMSGRQHKQTSAMLACIRYYQHCQMHLETGDHQLLFSSTDEGAGTLSASALHSVVTALLRDKPGAACTAHAQAHLAHMLSKSGEQQRACLWARRALRNFGAAPQDCEADRLTIHDKCSRAVAHQVLAQRAIRMGQCSAALMHSASAMTDFSQVLGNCSSAAEEARQLLAHACCCVRKHSQMKLPASASCKEFVL